MRARLFVVEAITDATRKGPFAEAENGKWGQIYWRNTAVLPAVERRHGPVSFPQMQNALAVRI